MHSEDTTADHAQTERLEAAECLFEQYGGYIRRILKYLKVDPEDAEDLYQELFLFFAAKPMPDNIENPHGFLYRVTIDKWRDFLRRKIRHRKRIQRYAEILPAHESPVQDQNQMEFREEMDRTFDWIDKVLTQKEAQAIRYRYQKDFDTKQTAKIMEVEANTVSRYVSVGVKKLKKLVKKQDDARKSEGEQNGLQ